MKHFEDSVCYGLLISAEDKRNYYKAVIMNKLTKEPVPKNLKQAVERLIETFSDHELRKITKLGALHFGLGRWIRNNWGLWGGGELQSWFHEKGIRHADDMSGIILESFRRELRGEDWDLSGQIKHYREYWKKKNVDPDKIGVNNG